MAFFIFIGLGLAKGMETFCVSLHFGVLLLRAEVDTKALGFLYYFKIL